MVRAEAFWKAGGLDGRFFAHMEEIDLCWRMLNHASSADNQPILVAIPQAVVYHLGGGTLGYENPRKTFLNFRNNLLMLYKNLPTTHRWWIMLVRFGMDYLAALQMLLTGQKENVKAVVRARCAYHKMKKEYTPIHDNKMRGFQLLARRSIVWDFYVRRKRV